MGYEAKNLTELYRSKARIRPRIIIEIIPLTKINLVIKKLLNLANLLFDEAIG